MKKKLLACIATITAVTAANASLVAWQTTNLKDDPLGLFTAGWQVEMFQDVGNDNTEGWQNGLQLTDGSTIGAGSLFGTSNDLMLGIFTTTKNVANVLTGINSVGSADVTDNIQMYTVVYNNADKALADQFIVLDAATTISGTVGVGGTPVKYDATPDGTITGEWQTIPEPATIGMMGIAGIGMFLARKKNRR